MVTNSLSLSALYITYGDGALVCGSYGACLDCMLPGVQVIAGLGFFFCVQVIYVIMKIVTPCFNRPSLLSRFLVG